MAKLRRIFLFSLLAVIPSIALCQQTQVYMDPEATFTKAMELFNTEKYSAAEHLFEQVAKASTEQSQLRIESDYYSAVCSMNLFHDDAEKRMEGFIENHPQSPKVRKIDFQLGNYAYRKRKFKEAITWYDKVSVSDLDKDEASEFYFKKGYSCFHQNKLDSAKHNFAEVKDAGSIYSAGALYYYGFIAYQQKNYQTAINSFLPLKTDARFGTVIPYYIANLYYLQGDYSEVPQYVIPLIDSAKNPALFFNADQVNRLIAESYYHLKKYSDAIPYFEKYAKRGGLQEMESYELGFCYYSTNKYREAIPWFQGASSNNDSLSQNALYFLASSYLKAGNKQFASNAFRDVYKMNYDPKLKEDALLNYAKLAYELDFDPFNEAIKAFNQYLNDYPNSSHKEEIYRYLVNVYLSTRNYPAALESLDKIKDWDTQLQAVYQRLTYYRGVDLFNNGQMDKAAIYFDNSEKYNFDQKLHLMAFYWKAEALYREKKYKDAIEAYTVYMQQPEAFSTPEYNLSQYGIGYSNYEVKDYDNSNIAFRKYVEDEKRDKQRLSDAYNRIGDGYFVQKEYESSVPYYTKNIELNTYDMDYAAYQKALALGVMHNLTDKVAVLEAFMKDYPKSTYRSSAMMELANTYMINSQPQQALDEYQLVLDNYPKSPYINQSLLQQGMIYFNRSENDKAQIVWDEVVRRSRNSPEGTEALNHIKMLYTSSGQIDKMKDYFHQVGADLSTSTLDSATFSVVKSEYLSENYTKMYADVNNYLQKFPQGAFAGEAHFYRGEYLYKQKSYDSSYVDYSYVIKLPRSFYTETALAKGARIEYDKKNFAQALDYYNALATIAQYPANLSDARLGKMNCNYQLKKYDATITSADTVLMTTDLDKGVYAKAYFYKAKSFFMKEQYDSSEVAYGRVITLTTSEMEAESKYNLAYIQYLKTDIAASEKTIFDLVNQEPSYPEWMAKGLIVLADDYLAAHDDFQAKHTLNTVIENATDTATVNLAKRNLVKINEDEKKAAPQPIQPNMVIPFSQDSSEYKKLFNQ
ncbi:MAG TPA: tetratricopeptide repeat protein [Bacteroidia bacterium]|nr:tetratricopeptide repeat protein [Bacteroidia bacterium]